MRTILFIGKPGSGKETQIRLLAKQTGFTIVSIGESFRRFQKKRGKLGRAVMRAYATGSLEPTWLASHFMTAGFLAVSDTDGIILDGAGRTLPEAKLFDEITRWLARRYVVIYLNISDREAVARQVGRARSDSDSKAKIRARLKEFEQHTKPACDFFRRKNVLIDLPAEGSIWSIHTRIISELEMASKRSRKRRVLTK